MGSGPIPEWSTWHVGAAERVHRAVLHAVREPAVPILLAAMLTQVWRRSWLDVAVFGGSAGLIAWDRPLWPARLPVPQPIPGTGRRRGLEVLLAGLVYGVVLAPLPRTSAWFSVGLAVPGLVAALAVIGRAPGRGHPGTADRDEPAARDTSGSALGWGVWVVLALVLAVAELAAFLSQSDPRVDNPTRPTISTLVDPWLQSAEVRTVAIGLWVWLGWWIVVRVRAAGGSGERRTGR